MALLNYTTSIPVEKTLTEIQQQLVKARAQALLTDYDGAGNPVALSFRIMTKFGVMAFKLPADPQPVFAVLKQQAQRGDIPRRFLNDVDQARRVAWRIVKDWVEAQLAIVETGMVTIDQVFLPYAQNPETGETVYQHFLAAKFNGLALPAPGDSKS